LEMGVLFEAFESSMSARVELLRRTPEGKKNACVTILY